MNQYSSQKNHKYEIAQKSGRWRSLRYMRMDRKTKAKSSSSQTHTPMPRIRFEPVIPKVKTVVDRALTGLISRPYRTTHKNMFLYAGIRSTCQGHTALLTAGKKWQLWATYIHSSNCCPQCSQKFCTSSALIRFPATYAHPAFNSYIFKLQIKQQNFWSESQQT